MLYIINYDIKSTDRENAFMLKAETLGQIYVFMPRCMFLQCLNISKSKDLIFKDLRDTLNDEDLLLITKAPFTNMAGWLTTAAVDWLSNHKQST